MRHRVKCVDRLLGNSHLEIHRFDLYAALAQQWLTGLPQLLVVRVSAAINCATAV
ncbi:MAG: hypothetical protein Q8L71_00940 [Thiobacillus sp.]|nr:hypothetical protein [Thiobacillus sp.]